MPRPSSPCVAVVGMGSIGTRHLRLLNSADSIKTIAVSRRAGPDLSLGTTQAIAKTIKEAVSLGASHFIIATETSRHVSDASEAASFGVPILIEKPLAVTAGDVRLLMNRVKDAKKLFVCYNLRFSESLKYFQQKLNEIGKIHSVRIECQTYLPNWRPHRPYKETYSARKEEGGVLLDLIQDIDIATRIFGWPEKLQATLVNEGLLGIESDEAADLYWHLGSGTSISMTLDYLTKPSHRFIRAFGSLGILEWDGTQRNVSLIKENKPVDTVPFSQSRDHTILSQDLAFANDRPSGDVASIEEALKTLAICDSARTSSESRCEQPVHYT